MQLFFLSKKIPDYSAIAQLVERMTVNHDVAGSSPACGVFLCSNAGSIINDAGEFLLTGVIFRMIRKQVSSLIECQSAKTASKEELAHFKGDAETGKGLSVLPAGEGRVSRDHSATC